MKLTVRKKASILDWIEKNVHLVNKEMDGRWGVCPREVYPRSLIGYGDTLAEAVMDLKQKIDYES